MTKLGNLPKIEPLAPTKSRRARPLKNWRKPRPFFHNTPKDTFLFCKEWVIAQPAGKENKTVCHA
jgi:hypothetical protein